MPLYCAAFNCFSKYNKELNLKFHRFPKDEQLKQKWVAGLNRSDYNPSKTAVICSEHFSEDDYYVNPYGTKVLKKNSVPSIFDYTGSSSGKIGRKRKRLMTEAIPSATQESTPCVLESSETSIPEEKRLIVPFEYVEVKNDVVEQEISDPSIPQIDSSLVRKRKRSVPAFIGDYEESDLEDPIKRHKYWTDTQSKIEQYKKKNKYLSCKLQRKNNKIAELKSILEDMRKKNLILQSSLASKDTFPKTEQELISRQLQGRCGSFSPKLKSFALTLNFHSPSAYNYVRRSVGKNFLPHPRTLLKWRTSVDGSAEQPAEDLKAVEEIKTEMEENDDEQNVDQGTC